eukprot:Nk52_evm86s224 gene=Nk52_evmTU86s224
MRGFNSKVVCVVLLLGFVGPSLGLMLPMNGVWNRFKQIWRHHDSAKPLLHEQEHAMSNDMDIKYEEKYFTQIVDHFNFQTEKKTFQQKYLINSDYWKKDEKGRVGPIFFYCGNEGAIEMFAKNTGFQWEAAKEFGALVVFAEHRYYGKSLPFGKESFGPDKIGLLTSAQALADYAYMLTKLKKEWKTEDAPVIAWGGSYGAMLAAWFRTKYPHVCAGAIASSGPVLYFEGLVDPQVFNKISTDDFARYDKECPNTIRNGLNAVLEKGESEEGRKFLSEKMKLCKPLKSKDEVEKLADWFVGGYTYMAMVNYPYPTSFLTPMPGWPVKESCKMAAADKGDLFKAVLSSVGIYYNYTGQLDCIDFNNEGTPDLGSDLWGYQTCTEMMMPMTADGVNDMFPPKPWNKEEYYKDCQKKWKTSPVPDFATIEYGSTDLKAASNIVFANGELDPWMGGGINENVSKTVLGFVIKDGAHHLDLRFSHPDDPQSVIDARNVERREIRRWIEEWHENHS